MINRNSVVGESEDLSLLEILREEEIVIQLTEEEIYNNANCIIKFNENIKQLVEETDIGAKFGSGTEKQLLPLFCEGTKRVNAKLYDFQQPSGLKIETKKMLDQQWFDIGKYYNLSQDEKEIVMLFILHDNGKINNKLYSIKLGEFLNICCNDVDLNKYGWDWDNIKIQSQQKQKYKNFQTKTLIRMKKFIKKHESKFNIFSVC